LIVAAFAFPLLVQGYWNRNVSLYLTRDGDFSETTGEPFAQWLYALKLQHDNGTDHSSFVLCEAAHAIKAPRAGLAIGTKGFRGFAVHR
jgi:hypothetical protein